MSAVAEIENISRTPEKTTSARPVPDRRSVKLITTLKCVVLSEDDPRLQRLANAVADAGYEPIVCSNVSKAWITTRHDQLHLAFVDLATACNEARVKDFSEHLVKDRKILVAICGAEDQPLQEVWARQVGTWLYLPGLASRDDLCSLCHEARLVVERMLTR